MKSFVHLVPIQVHTQKDGQTVFAEVPEKKRRVKPHNDWIDVEKERLNQNECNNCKRKVNLPHVLDEGKFVTLVARFHDGDKENKTRSNVSYFCQVCDRTLPKKRKV